MPKINIKNDKIKKILLKNREDNSMSRAKEIIECIDVGTWEYNLETGEIIFSNRWAEITGYNLKEFGPITKKKIGTITHPDDFEIANKLMSQHIAGQLPYYKYESRIKHKNGNWVWICERGSVIKRTKDGKPLLMFGTHTDITKKKQAELALENYIHTLNHDLKSPLTSIIGYSSFLLEDEDLSKEEIKKYSSVVNKTGKKMLKMIESYLSLAKIERGQDVQGKTPKKITELIEEINKTFAELINNKKLSIIFGKEEDKPADKELLQKTINVEEILIYSVINNLLHNAIEASVKTENEKIKINIYNNSNELCLSFFNYGEISKEFQKNLFKKFASTKKNGTGIGLYSARLIARAHGGDVVYEHTPGGTIFILKLPINI